MVPYNTHNNTPIPLEVFFFLFFLFSRHREECENDERRVLWKGLDDIFFRKPPFSLCGRRWLWGKSAQKSVSRSDANLLGAIIVWDIFGASKVSFGHNTLALVCRAISLGVITYAAIPHCSTFHGG